MILVLREWCGGDVKCSVFQTILSMIEVESVVKILMGIIYNAAMPK